MRQTWVSVSGNSKNNGLILPLDVEETDCLQTIGRSRGGANHIFRPNWSSSVLHRPKFNNFDRHVLVGRGLYVAYFLVFYFLHFVKWRHASLFLCLTVCSSPLPYFLLWAPFRPWLARLLGVWELAVLRIRWGTSLRIQRQLPRISAISAYSVSK